MGITAEHVRDHYGPVQAARAIGATPKQWRRLVEAGHIDAPEVEGRRWSQRQVLRASEWVRHLFAVDGYPIGAAKAAERLEWRLGRPPGAIDARTLPFLVEAGHLSVADTFKGHDLYDRQQLDALSEAAVDAAAEAREAWHQSSLIAAAAAALLGFNNIEFANATYAQGLKTGAEGRWDRAAVATLAADEVLAETIAAARLLGPDQAAAHMEIRRVDLDALVDAGRLAAAGRIPRDVGRWSTVDVPLYRAGDLDALLEDGTFDWEAVRATEKGRPSPLRALAPRRDRPAAVRRFAAALAEDYGVDVWTRFRQAGARWEIDWDDIEGNPTPEQVRERLAADPVLRGDRKVSVESAPGVVARWAREMLRPGAAVILDTETNGLDGEVLQIAVLDAASGDVLFESLVNPGDVWWDERARDIHGLGPAAVAGAPTWDRIHGPVLAAIGERTIIAYNAAYDRPVLAREAARYALDLGAAGTPGRWECAMEARSDYWEERGWIPLGGNHDAAGDCRATRAVLEEMTRPPWAPTATAEQNRTPAHAR